MTNYKNVRLEEHVYRMLEKRQRPRESMSQVVERLINNLEHVSDHIDKLGKILWEEVPWNTKS